MYSIITYYQTSIGTYRDTTTSNQILTSREEPELSSTHGGAEQREQRTRRGTMRVGGRVVGSSALLQY